MSNFISFNEIGGEFIINLDEVICIYTVCYEVRFKLNGSGNDLSIDCSSADRAGDRLSWIYSMMAKREMKMSLDDIDDDDETINPETHRNVESVEVINGGMLLHYDKGISTWIHIPEEKRQEMIDKLIGKVE